MIKIDNLKVNYGNHNVLNEVCLEILNNTIHGLVGSNGSGKTTLLNAICGHKNIQKGVIRNNEGDLKRNEIAYLETKNYFYPRITGKEYISMFQIKNPDFDIEQWNDLFELPLSKLIDHYSTGMKKKLALMGIICLDRETLILDEPFHGIDLETVQKIKTLLLELKVGKTILIASHKLDSLVSICDSISYVNDNKIQFTYGKQDFDKLTREIFFLHQGMLDEKIKVLVGMK